MLAALARASAQWTDPTEAPYRPRLVAETTRRAVFRGDIGMDEFQAAQLIAFVVAMSGLLLALEVVLRRARHRR
jgi:hypothetical protein